MFSGHLFAYFLIGSVAASTDIFLFFLFIYFSSIEPSFINVFSGHVGIILSYALNVRYNFKVQEHLF